ncbi:5390_t:CDS:2 [Paraglomus brasilianum]|uniref:Dolichol-phosphate mannosyltransferase subunit 3 n=1 Tax=Paraglomus brasilianum TaxID=144538 RepID=A0A9N8W511_9GLOM|nr:5390_t:CDS:2 [Paraglomus brasilianum]
MTKAIETATFLGIIGTVYFLFLFQVLPSSEKIQIDILPVLPWWALVSFGAYSLGNIGYHVYRFKDCEDAYHELMAQINEAKKSLRTQGISVD